MNWVAIKNETHEETLHIRLVVGVVETILRFYFKMKHCNKLLHLKNQ